MPLRFKPSTPEKARPQPSKAERLALEQLEVIRAQVDEMKAQTAVAKTSADAALLNARALIHSERPWIYPTMTINGPLIHDTSGPRLAVRVKLDNLGSTPAVGIVFEPRMYVLDVLKPNATDERKKMLDDLMNRTPVINSIAFPGHPLVFGYSIPLTTENVEKHEIKAGGGYVASVILGVVYRHTLDNEARYCTGAIYRLSKPLEKGGALFEIGRDVPQQDLVLELDTVFPLVVE